MPEGGSNPRPSSTPPGSAALLNASVVVADLLLIGAALLVTFQSLNAERTAAATVARNLATTLATGLTASFDRIDLSLQVVGDEHRRELEAGAVDGPALEALLARMRERTGDLLSLRVIDPDGISRYSAPSEGPLSLADREHFRALRDHPELAFSVGKPVEGRASHTRLIAVSRPLRGADGRFAGVASAAVSLERLASELEAVDVGTHGDIALRWDDMSPIVHRLDQPGTAGASGFPPAVVAELASGRTEVSYQATRAGGGATWAIRKLGRYPMYVAVGVSPEDYLAEWRRQAALGWLLVAGFLVLTVGGALYGQAAWRRRMGFERFLVQQTERLRESEERFRTAFATSPDPISLSRVDDGVFTMVNEGFTRMTGWTEAEALGRSSVELGIWESPADRERVVDAVRGRGLVENVEVSCRSRDGRVIRGLFSARPVEIGGEKLMLAIIRDISAWKAAVAERDRLQLEVQQAKRVEAIGRLAGGVAHDFNNLLTVILSAADALQAEATALSAVAREDLEELTTAGMRARDLTRQLLAFARKQVITPVPLDVAQAIRNGEKLLRRVLGEDVVLRVELAPDLWPILCDPAQLEQVIVNLAVNARDAMPSGGRLELSACNAEVRIPGDAQGGERQVGQWVRIRVRDTGTGIPPEVRAHLFEPFFTTKGLGKGTGLGLATVHGIVAQSGGHIEVESASDHGTTFDVYLPRSTELPVSGSPPSPPPALRPGHETVLVVEDEPLVRSVAVRALRTAGYDVLVAEDGAAAIELAVRHQGPIDLVVTDVVMPGLSGPQVVTELKRLRPGLRVLYVSGYAGDAIVHHGVLDPGIALLPKPFDSNALLNRVRTVIEARAGSAGG